MAVPLYCSVDPDKHRALSADPRFACDMSYMGTYAPDRQPKIDELLCAPARRLPEKKFIVAGPQYPSHIDWPENVEHIMHLNPRYHAQLYSSSRITLNVTRREMVVAGYSPSVRLFEAAACGAAIASDNWPGLETFFTPGREILLPTGTDDMVRYLKNYDDAELRRIGRAARDRVLAAHTSDVRAQEFEHAVEIASSSAKHARRFDCALTKSVLAKSPFETLIGTSHSEVRDKSCSLSSLLPGGTQVFRITRVGFGILAYVQQKYESSPYSATVHRSASEKIRWYRIIHCRISPRTPAQGSRSGCLHQWRIHGRCAHALALS